MAVALRTWCLIVALAAIVPAYAGSVSVELHEGVPDKRSWNFERPAPVARYETTAFGFVAIPKKFSDRGVMIDYALPLLMAAQSDVTIPAGEYRLLLRSRNGSRLKVDGKVVAETSFIDTRGDGHEPVPEKPAIIEDGLRYAAIGHKEKLVTLRLDAGTHRFELEAYIGGQKLRPEVGELLVAISAKGERFRLVSPDRQAPLTDDSWTAYAADQLASLRIADDTARKSAGAREETYWRKRHELARQEWTNRPAPKPPGADQSQNDIDRFLSAEQSARKVAAPPVVDDWTFLRRAFLDTVGVIPDETEIAQFFSDPARDRRRLLVDRLLADPRWADHWVSYWQDVLAENPGILKPNLNNTGPFRWWLHQALLENYGMDRFVTELIRMEGSKMYGGPAGFGMATENDAPMAAKSHVLAKAFLGIDMQCARCHDAPFHPFKQRDLFEMAAMLGRGAQKLPKTSTVHVQEGARKPRVNISLKPGEKIEPRFPFGEFGASELPAGLQFDDKDSRERFAAIMTSPHNQRFAQVIVNRLWKRYFGWAFVEPVDDWPNDRAKPNPLLPYLARHLGVNNYDLKSVARLILNSNAYQSVVQPGRADTSTERFFAGPIRRRLTAEQLVDGMFVASGKSFRSEELCMDPEGRRPATEMLNLGVPQRAWQLTSLSNERDRPALAFPMAQSVVDLLVAYGWRESRQNPITQRDETPTPLQALVLANGAAGNRIVRLSDDSRFTAMCLEDRPLSELVDRMFRAVLTRPPTANERSMFVKLLEPGYAERRVPGAQPIAAKPSGHSSSVSWANHLSPEATKIKLELERAARAGDPPTRRLKPEWRERFEDAIWTLLNSPEFAFVP